MNASFIKALIILPGTVTVFAPILLLWIEHGFTFDAWLRVGPATLVPGVILICLGLMMAVHTFRLFGHEGKGTPAPWNPPQRLVIKGAYRHVRNPMITGVFGILLGESLIFGSFYILGWFAFFFVGNTIYFTLVEEPGLRKRFGSEYEEYARNVPQWIPRVRPYEPEDEGS